MHYDRNSLVVVKTTANEIPLELTHKGSNRAHGTVQLVECEPVSLNLAVEPELFGTFYGVHMVAKQKPTRVTVPQLPFSLTPRLPTIGGSSSPSGGRNLNF
jgi:hypothetical protein